MEKSLTRSGLFEALGTPLRNTRWSWAARSPELRRSVFTVWANEIENGRYSFWQPNDVQRKAPHGRNEIKRILTETMDAHDDAFGVLCYPKYPLTRPRKIDGFEPDRLLTLNLAAEGGELVGYIVGEADADAVANGTNWQVGPVDWAVDDLRTPPDGQPEPKRGDGSTGGYYMRDPQVRAWVIERANGKCEYCGSTDFVKPDGDGYVEAHHIISLADQGPDTIFNVIALCASHHREAHYGADRQALEKKLLTRLAEINAQPSAS